MRVTAHSKPLILLCVAILRNSVSAICNHLEFLCNGCVGVSPHTPIRAAIKSSALYKMVTP